jgi:alkanesulfonate monooxygenase SsuD/methylene tetrahydromethanopterin reductase-like flavin-dependent oxidoreductase (luciferase family)
MDQLNRKLGVSLGSRLQWSDEEFVRVAQLAEKLGYDSLLLAESWGRDHFTVLSLMAKNTSRILLGTSITGLWARSPAALAQTASSLDTMAGGRLILGLGTGNLLVVEQWHGLKPERPVRRMREFIEIMRMIWRGERMKYEGEIFKLDGTFTPAYKGPRDYIPIYIGASGPKLTQLAGEISDGWMPTHVDIFKLDVLRSELDIGAQKAGRDPSNISITPGIATVVSDNPGPARERAKGRLALYVGGLSDKYHELMIRYGFKIEADKIRAAWKKEDYSSATTAVSEEMLDHFVIVGNAEHCQKQLEVCYSSGIDHPRIALDESTPMEDVYKSLEILAPEKR